MITARNLTNKDLEDALEVLRVVATHTDDNFAIVSEQEGWLSDEVYRV
tara:strand:+ start:584 stop:727 length:144 start_codon:yes stop_codon:yes gene_type:complete